MSSLERLTQGWPRHVAIAVVVLAFAAVAASIWVAPGWPGFLGSCLALIALAIAVIDARLFIIPNELTALAFALALAHAAITAEGRILDAVGFAVLRATVLAALFYGLREAYRRLRGRHGIGLGDVKLAGVAGAWLSWTTIPLAVEIAALTAIAVFLVRHYTKTHTLDTTLKFPFGLFFAPAIWLGWLMDATLLWPW